MSKEVPKSLKRNSTSNKRKIVPGFESIFSRSSGIISEHNDNFPNFCANCNELAELGWITWQNALMLALLMETEEVEVARRRL